MFDLCARVIDTYNIDNDKAMDLIYLDFQKAFDKVAKVILHERLLAKGIAHGIQGDAAQWIRYLL